MTTQALVLGGAILLTLLVVHVVATHGTGTLRDPLRSQVAITPRTTLSHWWHHLVAGFFHNSWGHLAYNSVLFAIAWTFSTRAASPWTTAGTMYAIGPSVVFLLHLAMVRPLAASGLAYAQQAMDLPLVGFSVMAFSVAGMALAQLPTWGAAASLAGIAVYEVVLAVWVTQPFVFAYHLAGLMAGFAVRRWI